MTDTLQDLKDKRWEWREAAESWERHGLKLKAYGKPESEKKVARKELKHCRAKVKEYDAQIEAMEAGA